MNNFREHYLAAALISAVLGGCSPGGDDGTAMVTDPEPTPPLLPHPPSMRGMIKMLSKMILSASKLLPQGLAVTHHSPTTGAESTAPT